MKKVKRQLLLLLCAVVSCSAAWAQGNVAWVKVTDYSNLSTNDTYVIAGNGAPNGTVWYSLRNEKTSYNYNTTPKKPSIPVGEILTISNGMITSTVHDYETWKLELVSEETDVYYIKSTQGNYYLHNVGDVWSFIDTKHATDGNNQWKIHFEQSFEKDPSTIYKVTGLYNVGKKRELAVYKTSTDLDWRCYGPSNYKSIKDEEVVLYRKVTSVPVSISSAKYASFSYACPLDFSGTGITVYKAKGTETAVTLTKVEDGIVPANQGVVLYSESVVSNKNVPIAATSGSTDWTDNELIGITERTKISVNGAEGKINYILSKEENVVGFYLAASGEGAYLAANRAYLSTSATHQLVPQYLGFEEETTGIESLTPTLSQGEGECYDLSGRRVAQPTKGMYIINGRKVVVK